MLTAAAVLGLLAAGIGIALALAAARLPRSDAADLDRVNDLLPQLQCAQCGEPGCRPYARAILAGTAPINRCAPGGPATVEALAALLQRPAEPLDPAYGVHKPPQVARIDEAACIGCALCLPACPVDAIVGAPRFLHTVIADECTGCELCVAPCPVDCISLEPRP